MARVKWTVIVFFSDGGNPCKYRNVTNLYSLFTWIERNLQGGDTWKYANVYYSSGKYYKRYYRENVHRGHEKGFNC